MSAEKRRTREAFRDAVFARDKHSCKVCGWSLQTHELKLDAHHITDRNLIPHGGYVKENGITLCPAHHELAEVFHSTGTASPGFAPDDLYAMVGSSYQQAVKASERLK